MRRGFLYTGHEYRFTEDGAAGRLLSAVLTAYTCTTGSGVKRTWNEVRGQGVRGPSKRVAGE